MKFIYHLLTGFVQMIAIMFGATAVYSSGLECLIRMIISMSLLVFVNWVNTLPDAREKSK